MILLGGGRRGDAWPWMYIWILGPPNIWETARARTLKLKTFLHMVKYSLWVHFFRWGRPGGAGPLRQLLVSDIKCFPYNKNNITVYSHTKKTEKKKIFRQHTN